ncbi:hypothetical protein A3728_21825 [Sulfitobacter sp. HI0040]|nr:hypothetical protein A3728_21825 [Sulfitobacter sp. HI0040]
MGLRDIANAQDKLEPGQIGQQPEGQPVPPLSQQAHQQCNTDENREGFPEIPGLEGLRRILRGRIPCFIVARQPE